MRARDRARAERRVRELAAAVDVALADAVRVVWAASLPDCYALALAFTERDQWVLLCAERWRTEPDQRADTVAHELAHLHSGDSSHGRAWRRAYRRIRAMAREMTW